MSPTYLFSHSQLTLKSQVIESGPHPIELRFASDLLMHALSTSNDLHKADFDLHQCFDGIVGCAINEP